MTNKNTRYVEILNNGVWIKHSFLEVKKGDYFTIWEEDGPMVGDEKHFIFKAIEDAYTNDEGIYTVEYEDV